MFLALPGYFFLACGLAAANPLDECSQCFTLDSGRILDYPVQIIIFQPEIKVVVSLSMGCAP
jgi:hypothetical protein